MSYKSSIYTNLIKLYSNQTRCMYGYTYRNKLNHNSFILPQISYYRRHKSSHNVKVLDHIKNGPQLKDFINQSTNNTVYNEEIPCSNDTYIGKINGNNQKGFLFFYTKK